MYTAEYSQRPCGLISMAELWSMRSCNPMGFMGKTSLFTLHFLWGRCGSLIYILLFCTIGLFGGWLCLHSPLFLSIQCILMHTRKLAPHLTVSLTLRWERRARGWSWKRNQTFCLENEMWAEPWEFFQSTLSSPSTPSLFRLFISCSNKYSLYSS